MARPSAFRRAAVGFSAWLDRKVGGHRPSAVYSRAATASRLTDDWYPSLQSQDRETKADGRLLRSRSRALVRDNAHAAGFIRSLQDNVIGVEEGGIKLQARNRQPGSKTFLRDLNTEIETRFALWGMPETASADGRDSWVDLQRLYVAGLCTDGEVLYRFLPGFDNAFGFAVEFIDPDQLDDTLNQAATDKQNEIRMGVEVDRFNRAVAFHVWKYHPTDLGRPRIRDRIPAGEGGLYHDFVKLRAGQTRGIPWFTPVLFGWKMLDGYSEAEVVQARMAACQGGFFVSTGEDAALWQAPTDPAKEKPIEIDLEPGLARQLPPGLRYEGIEPTHPNGNFAGYQKVMLRMFATGMGSSYSTFTGDFENTNYSSGRMGLLPERDFYRAKARWVALRFCRRGYLGWLKAASVSGALALPSLDASQWAAHRFQPRGWPWIDPLNDAQAKQLMRAMRLTSTPRMCAELGVDLEEILEEEQEARALAEQYGLTITDSEAPVQPRHDAPPPVPLKDDAENDTPPGREPRRAVSGARSLALLTPEAK